MMDKLYVVMKAGDILDWFVDDVDARTYALANDASVYTFANISWPHRAESTDQVSMPNWDNAPDEREIAARALDDFKSDVAKWVSLLSDSDPETRVLRKVNGWLHSRAKRLRAGKEGEQS